MKKKSVSRVLGRVDNEAADLVLLEKNPLVDIKNTGTIAGIVVKGKWFSKEKPQEMPVEAAKKNTRPQPLFRHIKCIRARRQHSFF